MIHRRDSSPKYIQLADRIRRAIESGEYAPGDDLPTFDTLAEWGYGRPIAQQALQLLKSEGLIDSGQGRRTKVRERRTIIAESASYTTPAGDGAWMTWKRKLSELGMEGKQRLGQVGEIPAPEEVAALLDLTPGDPVLHRPRVMLADNRPVQLADSYYPLSVAGGTPLAEQRLVPGGSYAQLTAAGFPPVDYLEEVMFRVAMPGEQSALEVGSGEHVIAMTRTVMSHGERPVECCIMILRADQHKLVYRLPAHS